MLRTSATSGQCPLPNHAPHIVGCVLFCVCEETASPTSLDMDASLLPIMEGNEMERIITSMKDKYLHPSLNLVEDVFAKWNSPEEGRTVRR